MDFNLISNINLINLTLPKTINIEILNAQIPIKKKKKENNPIIISLVERKRSFFLGSEREIVFRKINCEIKEKNEEGEGEKNKLKNNLKRKRARNISKLLEKAIRRATRVHDLLA